MGGFLLGGAGGSQLNTGRLGVKIMNEKSQIFFFLFCADVSVSQGGHAAVTQLHS